MTYTRPNRPPIKGGVGSLFEKSDKTKKTRRLRTVDQMMKAALDIDADLDPETIDRIERDYDSMQDLIRNWAESRTEEDDHGDHPPMALSLLLGAFVSKVVPGFYVGFLKGSENVEFILSTMMFHGVELGHKLAKGGVELTDMVPCICKVKPDTEGSDT